MGNAWPIVEILLGAFLIIFAKAFVAGNIKVCEFLYKKTGAEFFKYSAERMRNDSVRIATYIVGAIFIATGLQYFFV
jgi:hypothetical protein